MLSLPDFKEKQIIFIFTSKGERLSFKNDNLVIKNSDDETIHQSTCYRLFAIYIVGNITVTSGLLQRSERFGFTIVFMTYSLRPYGVWRAKTEGNFLLREKQYRYTSLAIACHLVKNKIENQNHLLKKIRNKDNEVKETIERLEGFKSNLIEDEMELSHILGFEGIASREYFKILFKDCNWMIRRPRVKHDPINSLQDTGYTILFNFIGSLLDLYGFDIYKGVYHKCFYQRKSLACDMMEPFRSIIDARIKKAHSLGQIKKKDFLIVNKQYRLFGKKSKPYIEWLLKEILDHKNSIFLYVQQYYRCFIREKPIGEYPIFLLSKE